MKQLIHIASQALILFTLLGTTSGTLLYSQKKSVAYPFIEVEDIPVKRAVTAFAQDTNGFLWFATYGSGLYKYDGSNFTAYKNIRKNPNSLSSSLVHAIYSSPSGTIWIGTEMGLSKYQPETDDFEQINLSQEDTPGSIAIQSIGRLDDQTLILGSHSHGAYTLDIQTGLIKQIAFETPINYDWIRFNSIATLNAKLYLGTSLGLFEYDRDLEKIVRSQLIVNNVAFEIRENINKLFSGSHGNLWIGTYSSGLFKLNPKGESAVYEKFDITQKRILAIAQLENGEILAGTENDGLFILDSNGKLIDNYTHQKFGDNLIQSNSVWSLYVDKDQRIWIGYYSNGIGFYDKNYDKFKDIESVSFKDNSLQYPSVTSILEDDNSNLWISMDGGGIDRYNPDNEEFIHLLDPDNPIAQGLTSSDIQSLFFDRNKNLWAASWNSGIYYLPRGAHRFTNFTQDDGLTSRSTICFAEDAAGLIYIGTFNSGLQTYDSHTGTFAHLNSPEFTKAGIANCDVRKIIIDDQGTIWVGTTKGLFTVEKDSNGYHVFSQSEKMYKDREGKLHYYILSLYQDYTGAIWIGTDGGGLCHYNPETDTYNWLYKIIPKETIASITGDGQGNIWLAGNNGITKYNTESQNVINYTKNDGLLANDFHNNSVLKSSDGFLYFGNYSGINYFNPNNLNSNVQQPSLYFSGLRLFNEEVTPKQENSPLDSVLFSTEQLTLNHNQSVFTIEYAAIDFTRATDNSYAYILEGFDNSWNYVGNTKNATYTNLPAGEYTFKVKAANNDGLWTQDPISLDIKILNPWWKQSWAVLCYLLIALVLFYLGYKFTQNRIEEKRLIKYERDKRQQEEELNTRKLQFFTNISHEFRTPLTLIKNPIEAIIANQEFDFPKTIQDKHNSIYRNTERLIRLINELMDFRKLQFNKASIKVEKIAITPFCQNIAAHFKEEAYQRNINLEVNTEEPELSIYADAGMLEKIVFNLLSNAFKATPDNGLVSISILHPAKPVILPEIDTQNPVDALKISIEDTGFGIPEEEITKIFAPFYQVEGLNKQYYGGTGIGLEVVRNFLLMNKGKIEVESQLDKGTTFAIYLALGTNHFKASEFLSKAEIKKEPQRLNTGLIHSEEETRLDDSPRSGDKQHTLLIVEDNFELRSYLKEQLKNSYRVIEATNGTEGLELAYKMIPDIIITDVLMPKMNGFEFCKQIKTDIKTSHIPVLMLTAKAQTADWLSGIEAGADVYINKPFDVKIIKSQLKQLIDSRQLLFNKYFGEVSNLEIKLQTSAIDKNFIAKVIAYIHANISDPNLNVENLADQLKLSRSQLYRKIKALTGQTANEFIRKIRLDKAKELLENGDETVSEVGYKVGFSTPSYFTRCFKSEFGKLPTEIK